MPENWQEAGFGIYVHWPFCEAKCPYCDFNSHVASFIDQNRWRAAYLKEIDRYASEAPDRVVTSIFFGGGTPSLMDPKTVEAIINQVGKHWTVSNNVEITLEANPSSVEVNRFHAYKEAGVNRVSLGVQALNDTDLQALGRLHTVDEALTAMETTRTLFERCSFDLMYARQYQGLSDWNKELSRALQFGFSHMSLYSLTIENGTAFGRRHAKGKLPGLPDDDLSADLYDATLFACENVGLSRYEVSNFAQPGEESRHNLIYWRYGDYLGIGPGAHGRFSDETSRRISTETALAPGKWLTMVEAGSGESHRVALTDQEASSEMALMGLRLAEGLDLERCHRLNGQALSQSGLAKLKDLGCIVEKNGRIIVQKQWFNVLERIILELSPN